MTMFHYVSVEQSTCQSNDKADHDDAMSEYFGETSWFASLKFTEKVHTIYP